MYDLCTIFYIFEFYRMIVRFGFTWWKACFIRYL